VDGIPKDYTTAGIFMLVSGAMNIGIAFIWVISLIWICIGVLWVVPMLVGLLELITGLAMLRGLVKPTSPAVAIMGMVAAALMVNPVSVVMEALAFTWLKKPEVGTWLERGELP